MYDMDETTSLEKYGIDLTAQARKNPVEIKYQAKVNQLIQALCRRIKNNPLLIGETEVAKGIAEGLAQCIVHEDVPDNLLNKRLIALNMDVLMAEPDVEQRLEDFMKEALNRANDIILFAPEVQLIFDIEATSPLDIGFTFTRAVTRGEIQVIGVTTVDELYRAAETNSALIWCFRGSKIQIP